MYRLLMAMMAFLWVGTPASAQLGPIEDIINDIFSGQPSHPPAHSIIDTIPVNIDIQNHNGLDGHSIVINAYKPVQPGMNAPVLIGQTRMLLTGLPSNLGLIVAVPEPVTRNLDFVVINGAVIDAANNEILISKHDQFYQGRKEVVLELVRVTTPTSTSTSGQVSTTPTSAPVQLNGKVLLPKDMPKLMRGASMIIELIEINAPGLSGGTNEKVITQNHIDLDQETAPFKFDLIYSEPILPANKSLVLRAAITDWAGRLVFETPSPVFFQGNTIDYQIMVEPAYQP